MPQPEVKAEIAVVERQVTPVVEGEYYEITAYTNGVESTGKDSSHPLYGVTASGEYTQAGVTIACPKKFKFGTRLFIEGVGERVCMDRGGHIKGHRLDLYIPNLDDALRFGRQTLLVREL